MANDLRTDIRPLKKEAKDFPHRGGFLTGLKRNAELTWSCLGSLSLAINGLDKAIRLYVSRMRDEHRTAVTSIWPNDFLNIMAITVIGEIVVKYHHIHRHIGCGTRYEASLDADQHDRCFCRQKRNNRIRDLTWACGLGFISA